MKRGLIDDLPGLWTYEPGSGRMVHESGYVITNAMFLVPDFRTKHLKRRFFNHAKVMAWLGKAPPEVRACRYCSTSFPVDGIQTCPNCGAPA